MLSASKSRFMATTALAALALSPAAALAQSKPPAAEAAAVEELVITGTTIRGVAAVASPTVQMGREQIQATGLGTVSDISRTIPQVIGLGADESHVLRGAQDSAANITRISGINLRGISNEATLILVNGRRIAPQGVLKATYDPSLIPTSAVERIEVVLDGASAIYGADAVAGVFNVITRKNFDGAETTLKYSFGDGIEAKIASQTFGKVWSTGSVFATYEYNNRSALNAAERPYLSSDFSSRGGVDRRLFTANPGNILTTASRTSAGAVSYAIPTGQDGRSLRTRTLTAGTSNRWDEFLEGDFLPKQVRHSVLANAYQKIGDNIEVSYEGFYTRRNFFQASPGAAGTFVVPTLNPFFVPIAGVTFPLCPASAGVPAGTRCQSVEYNFGNQLEPNNHGDDHEFSHAVGAKIDVWADWQLNLSADYSLSRSFQSRYLNGVNATQVAIALRDTNPATALNVYGDNGGNNPATLAKVLRKRETYAKAIQRDYMFKADGPLFDLPGGTVRLAIGGDYQDPKFSGFVADSATDPNNVRNTQTSYANSRHSVGVFGELFVPIIGDDNALPFVRRLNLSLALRRDDYSDFGTTTNPKIGAVWDVVDGMTFSGTWSTAFRAPSLIDSSPGFGNTQETTLSDPRIGGANSIGLTQAGNRPGIAPEDAETWSIGFTWQPPQVQGLRVSLSYYDIVYTNLIGIPPNTLSLAAFYPEFINLNPTDAQKRALIENNPTFLSVPRPLADYKFIVDRRRSNLGVLKQDGLDMEASYRFDAGFGATTLGFNFTKIFNLDRAASRLITPTSEIDRIRSAVDFKGRAYATWNSGPWAANLFVNYVDAYTNNINVPSQKVKSWTTFDGSASYTFAEDANYRLGGIRVTLSAQNLFDKDPPLVYADRDSFDSEQHSALGRYVSLEITKSW